MTPERWQHVRRIYEDALSRPAAVRSAFVRSACGDDAELQHEVAAMLEAHDSDSGFLEARPEWADDVLGAPDARPALSAGQQLAQYDIQELLGRGGMGEVYLAHDRHLRRKVAIKVLRTDLANDAERLRRFEREGLAVSALNHPNIVTVHEIGDSSGRAGGPNYIVTEYVEGETLRQRMARVRLTPAEAIDVARQSAAALAAAHAAGIVHRDFKPENIMLRPDGYVKVLDFGLAKLAERRADADGGGPASVQHTAQGRVMGTWRYMSPEQMRGVEVDARTDIFSLGVVLYEMVSGQPPFKGDSTADEIAAVLDREPAPLDRLAPNTPPALTEVVHRALRKDRAERYQHIQALVDDLQRLQEDVTIESRLTDVRRRDRRVPAALFATRARVAVISLLVVLGLLAAAYLTNSARGGRAAVTAIAVLPFTNESGNPALEYVADGVAESLIDRLARVPQLKVIARASSFRYKGQEPRLSEVAAALGVEAVIMGRVDQRDRTLVVRTELVNALDQTLMWSATYERPATDLQIVQAEIVSVLAERLSVRLTADGRRELGRRETAVAEAYDLLLLGRFHANQAGMEHQQQAEEYFQKAIALDPGYAVPYVELAFIYRTLMTNSALDARDLTVKAEAAVRRALALDNDLPQAHAAMAEILRNAWKWAEAEREFARAIELNPSYARARAGYAMFLVITGRAEAAVAQIQLAKGLDPLSPQVSNAAVSILYFARRHDEAIQAARALIDEGQRVAHGHTQLAYNYVGKRMYPEAIAAFLEGIRLGDNDPGTLVYLGAAYALNGERAAAQSLLGRLTTSKEYVSPGELAILYGALGQVDRAFAALERAYVDHDLQLQFLRVDPAFDPLRADPRFADLLRRVGLTDLRSQK